MTFLEWLNTVSQTAWPAVVNHLWQTLLFVGLAWGVVKVLKNGPARLRFFVWSLAAVKLAVPAILGALLLQQVGVRAPEILTPVAQIVKTSVITVSSTPEVMINELVVIQGTRPGVQWLNTPLFCTFVWFGGMVFLLSRWLMKRASFLRVLHQAVVCSGERELKALEAAKARLGFEKDVRLVLSRHIPEPGVWGVLNPVVILPDTLSQHLSDQELEHVLMHELTHITRYDNLIANVNMVLCCVFWFFPVGWWISKAMLHEREQACDERVLEVSTSTNSYAAGMLKVFQFGLQWRELAGVSYATGSDLHRRIENIMENPIRPLNSFWSRVALGTLVAGFGLILVGTETWGNSLVIQNQKTPKAGVRMTPPPAPPMPPAPPAPPVPTDGPPAPPETPEAPEAPEPPPMPDDETLPALAPTPEAPPAATPAPATAPRPATPPSAQAPTPPPAPAAPTPQAIKKVQPVYPPLARSARVQGDVTVETTVSETGDVISARAVSGHALLQQAALTAARQWKFEPAVYNGQPAKFVSQINFEFKLPTQEEDGQVIRRSEGVIRGNAINRAVPEFPEQAKIDGVEGDVTLSIKINEDGQVYSVEVLSGPKVFWDACLKAASQWKFNPTVIEGKPVKVMGQLTFRFKL
ncbi:MAG TPA: M56 family metallopeptidase [Acidobacteriota bacterium]|nr:M56 family metallopeptidase [Acidobacteriota bacterium]